MPQKRYQNSGQPDKRAQSSKHLIAKGADESEVSGDGAVQGPN
jgi:hypothetical protein